VGALSAPLALWLLGCGLHRVPHYEPVSWPLEPRPVDSWQVRDAVRADLDRGRLDSLRIDGRSLASEEVDTVDAEVLWALFSLTQRWARSAEIDLWVPYPDARRRPVTIRFDRRLGAELSLGAIGPRPVHVDRAATAAERQAVAEEAGLGEVIDGDAPWTVAELAAARVALRAIEPAARPLLTGLTLVRRSASPRAAQRELAWFDPTTEPPTIEVYDLCFASPDGFVGPVDAPLPSSSMTLVHEIGHALADHPLRLAWVRLQGAQTPSDAREARRAWRALGRHGPVMDSWAAVRSGPGPASYGARSLHESFAEAYALSRLDPAALQRAMPGAAEWFAAGGHLAAARPLE